MFRPLLLALVALGLWASLIPQVTYPSASSGEPSDQILVAWPGWGVQQDLGTLSGAVGAFQVWVSAEPGGDRVTVWASLVDASTREVLRQTSINAAPDSVTVLRTLNFPSYIVPTGQRLLLQLQVADFEHNYVIYKLAAQIPGLENAAVNGVPDVGDGPLAFAHMINGSGLRTAILGDPSARFRIALAGTLTLLAFFAHPRIASRLGRVETLVRRQIRRSTVRVVGIVGSGDRLTGDESASKLSRVLDTPWYPWTAATVPILHFLASNTLHFAVVDAIVPLAIVLVVVTGSMAALSLALRDAHRPALVTAVVLVIFFGYGHLARAVDDRVDERVIFASSIVLAAAVIVGVLRAAELATRWTQLLNLVSVVLLTFPVVTLSAHMLGSIVGDATSEAAANDLVTHVLPQGIPEVSGPRPDIYYIILDEYTRNDALGEFDNSEFVSELERRGFYVASEATSNYTKSIKSIPSSLNMSYLDNLGLRSAETDADLIEIGQYNALAEILKSLGYTYVHLESGHSVTRSAPLADHLVTFTPSGVGIVRGVPGQALQDNKKDLWRLPCEMAQTILLWPVFQSCVVAEADRPYDWWSPLRALRMFEVLTEPIEVASPKFVFAHIVKPHPPATFDKHGNYVSGVSVYDEFDDRHDPSVPNSYVGQLIFINSLVLDMVDNIIRNSESSPIIVIAGDHGRHHDAYTGYLVLAAFHLPDGGEAAVYPSISSVNHFRAILNYYFGLEIDLLEDRAG